MSGLFGTPSMPIPKLISPPSLPPAPPAAAKLKEEEKKKLAKGRERRRTILTGPRGILGPAQVELKRLLGE